MQKSFSNVVSLRKEYDGLASYCQTKWSQKTKSVESLSSAIDHVMKGAEFVIQLHQAQLKREET